MKYSAIALSMVSLLALSACDSGPKSSAPASTEQGAPITLESAVNHEDRTPAYVERDQLRHSKETLEFFELAPSMTVVEIWPGGGYYSEVLARHVGPTGLVYLHNDQATKVTPGQLPEDTAREERGYLVDPGTYRSYDQARAVLNKILRIESVETDLAPSQA